MKRVGPGLDDLIYDSARGPAVLRSVVVGENLELFHRVRIGIDHRVVAEKIIVVDAVDQER